MATANNSRKVTKLCYAVEVAIGKIKSRFRFLDSYSKYNIAYNLYRFLNRCFTFELIL